MRLSAKNIDRQNEKIEKIEKLTDEFENTPLLKKLREEQAAETLQKRQKAASIIEAMEEERDKIIPQLQEDHLKKEAKFNEAKALMETASGEFQGATYALARGRQKFEYSIGREKVILLETAPEEIQTAIQFFQEKLSFLRSPGRISFTAGGSVRNIFTMKKTVVGESNRDAVRAALFYCQSAIKELENLKLSPALDMEKIGKMKAGIPDIDVYSESTGEKPLERAPDPLAWRKTDSQMDWEMGKLNEKIKKVIKR